MSGKKKLVPLFFMLAMTLLPTALRAQKGRISGYMFGDYYLQVSHPDEAIHAENRNAFQIRRIYFTYDDDPAENFSMRFRLEMNSRNYENSGLLSPYVKHAWLAWKNILPRATLFFGLAPTPTWSYSEMIWGYRSVSKSVMDLRGLAASADLGISLVGSLDAQGMVNYSVQLANGTGKRGEDDRYKKLYLSLPLIVNKSFFIVPYFDYESTRSGSRSMKVLFIGVKKTRYQGGVEVFSKTERSGAQVANRRAGLSCFASGQMREHTRLFFRYDYFDPDDTTRDDAIHYIITGVDYELAENIHLIPNLKNEQYQQTGLRSNTIVELTFFYLF